MTGGTKMIRNLTIGLVFPCVAWSSAEACSPIPEAMSEVQFYQSITPSDYQNWNHPDLSVGLVYAKKKKTRKRKVTDDLDEKSKKKSFVKIEFDLINNISGDFILDEPKWFPRIDKNGEARERELINEPKDFAFWDRRDLTVPGVYGYAGVTSCGPHPSDTLLPNQYYLHFKQKNRTLGLEIVSGPDDPLVDEFIKIQSGKLPTKVYRAANKYFNEMSGYIELEVKACPHADSFEVYGFNFFGRRETRKDLISESFEALETFKSEASELDLYDFYSYISRTNEFKLDCNIGDRYLVTERLSESTSRGRGYFFGVVPPRHRYLKIENEKIDTKNILSMISIRDETPNTETVKSWIREANTE